MREARGNHLPLQLQLFARYREAGRERDPDDVPPGFARLATSPSPGASTPMGSTWWRPWPPRSLRTTSWRWHRT